MKKKIAILGSTGSIGKNTLDIIKEDKKNFKIELLSTNKNIKEILRQSKKFDVKNLIIHNEETFIKNSYIFKKKKINVFNSVKNFLKKSKNSLDYTMVSIIGLDGLKPTLEIIKKTKIIALANKESIICGWNLIEKELKKNNTKFIPVDSEHFSIQELIKKENKNKIKKIYITASGGPFLNKNLNKIKKSTPTNAIKHPTWKMGKKISIDSSTLMNKVFELIEAKKIFKLQKSKFDIIIQPTSYVHAIVEFNNGVTEILTHPTSMKIPIFNSLYDKVYSKLKFDELNFLKLNNLNFQKINYKKFPINKIINLLPENESLYETVLITANDTLVDLYLDRKIFFYDIYINLNKVLNLREFIRYKSIKPKNINQILELRNKVRLKTQSLSVISDF